MTMDDETVLVDTNVLLTATAVKREQHRKALAVLDDWPRRGIRLCASGQVLREYLVAATRPAEQNGLGLSVADALANVKAFSGRLHFLDENEAVGRRLHALVEEVGSMGKQVHDANLVATALVHGVPRLLTENLDDFQRFSEQVELVDLAGL